MYGIIQLDYIGGNIYFGTLIKRKDEVVEVFKKFNSIVERQSDHKLKVLKIDGGGENVSKEFERFCDQDGTYMRLYHLIHRIKMVLPKGESIDHKHDEKHLKGKNLLKELEG